MERSWYLAFFSIYFFVVAVFFLVVLYSFNFMMGVFSLTPPCKGLARLGMAHSNVSYQAQCMGHVCRYRTLPLVVASDPVHGERVLTQGVLLFIVVTSGSLYVWNTLVNCSGVNYNCAERCFLVPPAPPQSPPPSTPLENRAHWLAACQNLFCSIASISCVANPPTGGAPTRHSDGGVQHPDLRGLSDVTGAQTRPRGTGILSIIL